MGINVEHWEAQHDREVTGARRQWSGDERVWGIFGVPESRLGLLPTRLDGLDVVELGCGTGFVSAWLARAGARPVGIDPTPGQLALARQCQVEFDLSFPLVRAAGEQVPFRDASFDLAISDGAAIWADPYRGIPEAARLLRPGGQLVFLVNSTLLMLCAPEADDEAADARLLRPLFGMHRFDWPAGVDPACVDFHLSPGDTIRLLRANGFEIEDLIEVRSPEGATTTYPFVTAEWAQQWPCEEVWKARKR
ncbi:MAG: class I SAM-dependent methyltransferase [Acidimicrobiales bacterium]